MAKKNKETEVGWLDPAIEKRNKVMEVLLFVILIFQILVMGATLVLLFESSLSDQRKAEEVVFTIPFWVAGLIPILISRTKSSYDDREQKPRQVLLFLLIILAGLLLIGTISFFQKIIISTH